MMFNRFFAFFLLACALPSMGQTQCDLFNIQDLASAYLSFQVDTVLLQPNGSYAVELSNGEVFTITLGCTDSAYFEYSAQANVDDGSCTTLIVPGCMNPSYTEFSPGANLDDGSCATYDPTCTSPTFDGHSYAVVYIGGQCWFAENLQSEVYSNGDAISGDLDNASWSGTSAGAQAVQGNDPTNLVIYGRLYNWHAVQDARNVCPIGWKVPSNEEWNALISNVGENAGTQLKSINHWNNPSSAGTDVYGFDARPGGYRFSSGGYYGPGGLGDYWSTSTWRQFNSTADVGQSSVGSVYEEHGFSVRCMKGGDILGCTDPAFIEYNPAANADDGSCQTPQ